MPSKKALRSAASGADKAYIPVPVIDAVEIATGEKSKAEEMGSREEEGRPGSVSQEEESPVQQ